MTSLLPYALTLLVSLPLNARSELQPRQIPADADAVRQARLDPARGLAMYCERHVEVFQGVLCETIHDNDLAAAQARLVLRSAGETRFVDGDLFVPASGRQPALLERAALGYS